VSVLDQCGPTQRRLLEALLHEPEGLSVAALTEVLGITPNAVRQHLTALEEDGLVAYRLAPIGRGRPQHLYHLSQRGQEVFPRRYRELAETLLLELGAQLGEGALEAAMLKMGCRTGQGAAGQALSAAATAREMTQLGYQAKAGAGEGGEEEIIARNCVFHRLAEKYPAVCQFDIGFLEAATGRQVEHRECMLRGGQCCRFGLQRKPG
jgi:predicted ArsR family transcriptional regulator